MKQLKELFRKLMYKLGYVEIHTTRVEIKEVHYRVEMLRLNFRYRFDTRRGDTDKIIFNEEMRLNKRKLLESVINDIEVKEQYLGYDEYEYQLSYPIVSKK